MEKENTYNTLTIEGTKYRTLYTEKFKNRKNWVQPDKKKIVSIIPGTIKKIYVKERKKIKAGDKIVVLESMKMKNDITVPINGTIKKINVKEGQKIAKEELILELE